MSGRIERRFADDAEADDSWRAASSPGRCFLRIQLIHAFTRAGFDLGRHPISLLSLGELGWVQIAMFVASGMLYLACCRRPAPGDAFRPGWHLGSLFIGTVGMGLIAAGVFVVDPGAGFPPGAPAGAPVEITWHGALHEVGFIVAMLSGTAACFVFARRFAGRQGRGWVGAAIVAALAAFVLTFLPDPKA